MRIEVPPSDTQLLAAGTGGDEAAFGQLFERHARAVYNHAFRLCGSWSVAEDVTQTTFVTAWRRRREVRLVDGTQALAMSAAELSPPLRAAAKSAWPGIENGIRKSLDTRSPSGWTSGSACRRARWTAAT